MKNLENYLKENYEKGVIDHLLRVFINEQGEPIFYIHANGFNSDTLYNKVNENTLTLLYNDKQL